MFSRDRPLYMDLLFPSSWREVTLSFHPQLSTILPLISCTSSTQCPIKNTRGYGNWMELPAQSEKLACIKLLCSRVCI